MNKNNSQSGFGVVEIILVLVIIGIIGFTGWRVYEANREVSNAPVDNSTIETSTVPKDWTKYTNKDLGFSFAYPNEWGDVVQTSSPRVEGRSYEGGHYYFTFSEYKDFKVAAKSADYKYTGLGMDAPLVNGFTNFDDRYQQIQNDYKEIVKKTDKLLVYMYAEGFQGTMAVQGISKTDKLPGLDFALSIPIQTFNLPDSAYPDLYSGETSPKKYLTQKQIDTVVKFAENVKSL